jgi:hypothetical protein
MAASSVVDPWGVLMSEAGVLLLAGLFEGLAAGPWRDKR